MIRQQMKKNLLICFFVMSLFAFSSCGSGSKSGNGQETVKQEEYSITVMDQNGEVIEDATVTYNGSSATTNTSGNAKFTLAEQKCSLTVTKKGYVDYINSNYTSSASKADIIELCADSLSDQMLGSAYYVSATQTVDLLTGSKRISTASDKVGFNIVTGTLGTNVPVKKYELHQKCDDANGVYLDTKIAESTTGTFEGLNVTKFSVGTGVYVKVIDQNDNSISTNLCLEIAKAPNYDEEAKFSFGEELTFPVSEDIPFFGGSEFSVNIPDFPMEFEVSEHYFKLGINMVDSEINEEELDEIKETLSETKKNSQMALAQAKNIKETIKKYSKPKTMKMPKFDKEPPEFSMMGYIEGEYDSDGVLADGTGFICISVEASAEFDWQTAVWIVPVNVSVEGTITADLTSMIGYDFYENQVTGDVALNFGTELKLKAGVGVDNLSAGVYGSAGLDMTLALASTDGSKPGFRTVDLNGDLGLYADVAITSYEKSLLSGTINLYPGEAESEEVINNSGAKTLAKDAVKEEDMYDISNYSLVMPAEQGAQKFISKGASEVGNKIETMVSDVYSGAEVTAASASTGAIMVYTTMITDSDSEEYGKTKLMMSQYDFDNQEYKEPVLLNEESVVFESKPQLLVVNDEIYLLYLSNDSEVSLLEGFDEMEDEAKRVAMNTYMRNSAVNISKYDASTGCFENPVTISKDDTYNYNLSLGEADGKPVVAWMSNESGEVFGTAKENTLNYAILKNDAWKTDSIAEGLGIVVNTAVGSLEGSPVVVYTGDADGDLVTTADREIHILDNSGSAISSHTGDVGEVKFAVLPGQIMQTLIWEEGGNLSYIQKKTEDARLLFHSQTAGLVSEFMVTSDAIYYVSPGEESSNLYQRTYDTKEDSWKDAVQVTFQEGWMRNCSIVNIEDTKMLLCQQEEFDIDESNLTTDISVGKLETIKNLINGGAIVDYDTIPSGSAIVEGASVVTNAAIEMEVMVINAGTEAVKPTIQVYDPNGNELVILNDYSHVVLEPGETEEIFLQVRTPLEFKKDSYIIEINEKVTEELTQEEIANGDIAQEITVEDMTPEDNKAEITIGFGQISLSMSQYKAGKYSSLIGVVENKGNVNTSGELVVLDPNNATKKLYGSTFSDLEPGQRTVFKINVEEDWIADGNAVLKAEVVDCNTDLFSYDNYVYQNVTTKYGDYTISYELKGGKNSSDNPTKYTPNDVIELKDATRTGYTFEGWFTNADLNEGSKIETIEARTAGDLTLYANWKKKGSNTSVVGKKFTKGTLKYKVLTSSSTRTVAVVGVKSKSIKKVTIPKTVKYKGKIYKVTKIGAKAFANCTKLKKIEVKSKTIKKVGKNAFMNIHKKCKIKVPKQTYKSYKKLFAKKGQKKSVKIKK